MDIAEHALEPKVVSMLASDRLMPLFLTRAKKDEGEKEGEQRGRGVLPGHYSILDALSLCASSMQLALIAKS